MQTIIIMLLKHLSRSTALTQTVFKGLYNYV
jgi:hypothetical protein